MKYVKHFFKVIYLHSVHPLSVGGLSLLPNFQKGAWQDLNFWREVAGKEGVQLLEGGCWKRGGDFFSRRVEGLQFLNKK